MLQAFIFSCHLSVHPSVRYVVSALSMVFVGGFSPNFLSEVHFRTDINRLGFGVKRSKVGVTARANMLNIIFSVCFCSVYGVHWWIFSTLLSLVHFETKTNLLWFWVSRPKVKVWAWPKVQWAEAYRSRCSNRLVVYIIWCNLNHLGFLRREQTLQVHSFFTSFPHFSLLHLLMN